MNVHNPFELNVPKATLVGHIEKEGALVRALFLCDPTSKQSGRLYLFYMVENLLLTSSKL